MLKLKPVWGIDIGDSALKAVKLKAVGKQIVLQDFQIIRYADVAGSSGARREDGLAGALESLQAAGVGRDPCYVSIAPQSVFSRFINLPPVDKRRVPEIVLYEARQQIPFDLSQVIWAYQPVRKEFMPGEEIEIGLFAVKRDIVGSYLGELSNISKTLYGIQVAPLALYNFIRYDVPLDQPTVIMDMGAQSTDLLIVDGPRFWLRNLPIAGNTFTSTLEKRLKISRADAEKLKYSVGESRHRRKLLEVLRPSMRDLVGEIQRSIGYYKSLSQDVKFEEILVTGDGYKLFGLDRFLTEQLQYRVTPVNQLRNVTVQGSPELASEIGDALPSLGVAMGLALQGLDQGSVTIDLLPDDFVIRRELHKKRFSGLVAAALLWAIMGCFFLKESRSVAAMQEIESSGEQTLQSVETLKKRFRQASRQSDESKLEIFERFGANREYYARVISAISEAMPKGIKVTSGFTFSGVDHGSGGGDGTMGGLGGGMPGMGGLGGAMGGGSLGSSRSSRGSSSRRGRASSDNGDAKEETVVSDLDMVKDAGLILTFTATCDSAKGDKWFKNEFPKYLKQAKAFPKSEAWPERMPIVTGVVVGDIEVLTVGERGTSSAGGARGMAQFGGGTRGRMGGSRGSSLSSTDELAPQEKEFSATIVVGLLTASESVAKFAGKPIEDAKGTSVWGLGMASSAGDGAEGMGSGRASRSRR